MIAKFINEHLSEEDITNIGLKESDYLYVKRSQIPNSGMGLFTSIDIYKGEIISVYKGDILTYEQAIEVAKTSGDEYFIDLPNGTIMDSKNTKCFAKYANDAEGLVKTKFKNNSEIRIDDKDRPVIVATRDIKEGSEIFCSYGKYYWDNFKSKMKLNKSKYLNEEGIKPIKYVDIPFSKFPGLETQLDQKKFRIIDYFKKDENFYTLFLKVRPEVEGYLSDYKYLICDFSPFKNYAFARGIYLHDKDQEAREVWNKLKSQKLKEDTK